MSEEGLVQTSSPIPQTSSASNTTNPSSDSPAPNLAPASAAAAASNEAMSKVSENLEDILIELTKFEKEVAKAGNSTDALLKIHIPDVLEDYLKFVADDGAAMFPWSKIKPLFHVKLEQVIDQFTQASPTADIPPMPNVDPFNFDTVKDKVFEQLEAFVGIPFTMQRLAELITAPKKHYRRTDKFMRALEKNMLVVSTVEAQAAAASSNDQTASHTTIVNGDHNVLPRSASPMRRAHSPTSTGFVKMAKLSENEESKDSETDHESMSTSGEISSEAKSTADSSSKDDDQSSHIEEPPADAKEKSDDSDLETPVEPSNVDASETKSADTPQDMDTAVAASSTSDVHEEENANQVEAEPVKPEAELNSPSSSESIDQAVHAEETPNETGPCDSVAANGETVEQIASTSESTTKASPSVAVTQSEEEASAMEVDIDCTSSQSVIHTSD